MSIVPPEIESEFANALEAETSEWISKSLSEYRRYDQQESIASGALDEGTRIEREHTDDPRVAEKIAKDHLAEDPAYYDKLKAAGL